MKELYFEEVKTRRLLSAKDVDDYADQNDKNRNRVNYGSTIAWSHILRDFGHSTGVSVWEDGNGCLRIPRITIDGKVMIEFHNGCKESG